MKNLLTAVLIVLSLFACGQTTTISAIQTLRDQGRLKEAINLSSTELTNVKNNTPLYKIILGLRLDCYMQVSDFKSAIEDWKTLIAIEPSNIANYVGISYAYWSVNDVSNCLNSIHKAYELNPNDPLILSNLSYYYAQAAKYDESIELSSIGLKQNNVSNTTKGLLLNNRAYAYIGLKQYTKAIEDVNQSLILIPDNSYAYCYRALANIGLNKMENVCSDLEKSKALGGVSLTKDLFTKYCK